MGNPGITDDTAGVRTPPLSGCRVIERARTVAGAYAGRLLATLGADVLMLEPPGGSVLRTAPPFLPEEDGGDSALFTYLACGKRSLVVDPRCADDRLVEHELSKADILIDDTPVDELEATDWSAEAIAKRFPAMIRVGVLPFGASGPKAGWRAEELNLVHASGEGFLLPNGRSNELFPQRPPLKIYGHFASYQGGCAAALSALAAWWARSAHDGQDVDVSVQDAMLLCGAFALQRLGDGSLEHRESRRFKYGGVFEARDGFIELLTLEDRQWKGLVQLLGNPIWAADPALDDGLERSRRGGEINDRIRAWVARHDADDIVARAQQLGVPVAKYRTPEEVVHGEHERARGLFAPLSATGNAPSVLVAPYRFRLSPLDPGDGPPGLDEARAAAAIPEDSR